MEVKAPRSPKSKTPRNPVRTKSNLLQAGIELFSDRGYDGVAVEAIVDLAGCNKRMLYHYFGNKDGLYVEVLREVFSRLESLEIKSTADSVDAPTAICEILGGYFDFLQLNPEFVNLLMWENLNGARFLEAHPGLLSKGPILTRLREVLDRGTAEGVLQPMPDVRQLLVLLIGVCFIYFSNRHTLKHTVGLDLEKPEVLRQGLELATGVVLQGLLKR